MKILIPILFLLLFGCQKLPYNPCVECIESNMILLDNGAKKGTLDTTYYCGVDIDSTILANEYYLLDDELESYVNCREVELYTNR